MKHDEPRPTRVPARRRPRSGFGAFVASATDGLGPRTPSTTRWRATPTATGSASIAICGSTTRTFTFLCAPNDTHNCILNAYVRSGVDHAHRADDALRRGDRPATATAPRHRWDPRVCQKGLALTRRFYGDRRVRHCMVRAGFKRWVEDGFPRGADGRPPARVLQPRARRVGARDARRGGGDRRRGAREHRRDLHAARRARARLRGAALRRRDDRGDGGRRHAGAQVPRRHAAARHDARLRHVPHGQLDGAARREDPRASGPTRRSAAAASTTTPGTPTCRRAIRWSPASRRSSSTSTPSSTPRRVVVWGMNWITTKMPDAHWLTEARLKGTRVVVIACEYSATATQGRRRDRRAARARRRRWRSGSPTSSCARSSTTPTTCGSWTDLPLLVRMDTLKYLRAQRRLRRRSRRRSTNQTRVVGRRREGAAARRADATCSIPDNAARTSGATTCGGTARPSAPRPLTRDEVGEHSHGRRPAARGRGRGHARRRQEGALPAGVRSGARVRGALRSEDGRGDSPGRRPRRSSRWRATSPRSPGTTLFAVGMGPNQFFNNDNKDRDIFLLAALTGNVGKHRRQRRLLRRQLPRRAVQRRAAVHQRESVRHRARPGQAGAAEAVLEGRVGALLQPRGPSAARRQQAAHRQDAHARRRPSRCGSPTPTRSSATSSGTTTRWSTCCRGSR